MAQDQPEVQQVEQTETIKGKLIFGSSEAIKSPTPKWATIVFRVILTLTTGATILIVGDSHIPGETKAMYALYLKVLDYVTWGIGRLFGVKKTDFDDN